MLGQRNTVPPRDLGTPQVEERSSRQMRDGKTATTKPMASAGIKVFKPPLLLHCRLSNFSNAHELLRQQLPARLGLQQHSPRPSRRGQLGMEAPRDLNKITPMSTSFNNLSNNQERCSNSPLPISTNPSVSYELTNTQPRSDPLLNVNKEYDQTLSPCGIRLFQIQLPTPREPKINCWWALLEPQPQLQPLLPSPTLHYNPNIEGNLGRSVIDEVSTTLRAFGLVTKAL